MWQTVCQTLWPVLRLPVMTSSPLKELVDRALTEQGYDLKKSVIRKRKAGESWQAIAWWIKELTGRTVTAETVRRWYNTIT